MAVGIATTTLAQIHVRIHGGPSFPSERHEELTGAVSGLKKTGFIAGIIAEIPLKKTGLLVVGGFDVLYAELTEEHKTYLASNYGHDKFREHFNVPILLGGSYRIPISGKLGFFGELQGGMNIFKVTTSAYMTEGRREFLRYRSSKKPAFKVAGGLVVSEKVTLGMSYYSLGKHRLRSLSDGSNTGRDIGGYDSAVMSEAVTMSFGVSF